jgi:hypothetical protein
MPVGIKLAAEISLQPLVFFPVVVKVTLAMILVQLVAVILFFIALVWWMLASGLLPLTIRSVTIHGGRNGMRLDLALQISRGAAGNPNLVVSAPTSTHHQYIGWRGRCGFG